MSDKKLTIGMAVVDDYDGIFYTIQSLRLHHSEKVNFIVLDNNPSGSHSSTIKKFIENSTGGKYIPYDIKKSSFSKYQILNHVETPYYLGLDSHVLLHSNAINGLMDYFSNNPDCKDIIQGPLLYDDLKNVSTHFEPVWRTEMYGIWGLDHRVYENKPFEIPMNGMGLFACETKNFPKINDSFKGFGGEEWYIQEKFRQNGGKCICIPDLKWNHKFDRPDGIKYPNILEERFWNYYLGWMELYRDPENPLVKSISSHFKGKIPDIAIQLITEKINSEFK